MQRQINDIQPYVHKYFSGDYKDLANPQVLSYKMTGGDTLMHMISREGNVKALNQIQSLNPNALNQSVLNVRNDINQTPLDQIMRSYNSEKDRMSQTLKNLGGKTSAELSGMNKYLEDTSKSISNTLNKLTNLIDTNSDPYNGTKNGINDFLNRLTNKYQEKEQHGGAKNKKGYKFSDDGVHDSYDITNKQMLMNNYNKYNDRNDEEDNDENVPVNMWGDISLTEVDNYNNRFKGGNDDEDDENVEDDENDEDEDYEDVEVDDEIEDENVDNNENYRGDYTFNFTEMDDYDEDDRGDYDLSSDSYVEVDVEEESDNENLRDDDLTSNEDYESELTSDSMARTRDTETDDLYRSFIDKIIELLGLTGDDAKERARTYRVALKAAVLKENPELKGRKNDLIRTKKIQEILKSKKSLEAKLKTINIDEIKEHLAKLKDTKTDSKPKTDNKPTKVTKAKKTSSANSRVNTAYARKTKKTKVENDYLLSEDVILS